MEKDDNLKYDLASHADIEKISYLPSEQEVLFFPFSSFEIKDIKEKELNKDEKFYEIYLFYLGKYLKHIESDEKIKMNENMISESEFKKQIIESGLIKKEKIQNINIKTLYNTHKNYENDIKLNQIKKKND